MRLLQHPEMCSDLPFTSRVSHSSKAFWKSLFKLHFWTFFSFIYYFPINKTFILKMKQHGNTIFWICVCACLLILRASPWRLEKQLDFPSLGTAAAPCLLIHKNVLDVTKVFFWRVWFESSGKRKMRLTFKNHFLKLLLMKLMHSFTHYLLALTVQETPLWMLETPCWEWHAAPWLLDYRDRHSPNNWTTDKRLVLWKKREISVEWTKEGRNSQDWGQISRESSRFWDLNVGEAGGRSRLQDGNLVLTLRVTPRGRWERHSVVCALKRQICKYIGR